MTGKKIPEAYPENVFKTFRTFTRDPLSFLKTYAINASGISSFRIFHYRMIHLSHPDHLQHVLEDTTGKYTQSRDRDHMKLLFGDGLLTTSGKHWQKQRTLIQPVFGKQQIGHLADKILKQTKSFPLPEGKNIDLHAYSLDLVNRIMADIMFSDTGDEVLKIGNALMELKGETLKRLSDFALPLWVPTSRNLQYKKARVKVYENILQQIRFRKASGTQRGDLLDAFLEARDKTSGRGMTEKELTEELLGVYAAAHEPVAIGLTYALFLVAKHPGVKDKLSLELDQAVNGAELDAGKYPLLNYTKAIIQETLRLYPPVWVSGKRALTDDQINGFEIRKNDNLMYSPVLIHRHPDFWEHPETFDPERFVNARPKHPFAYFPFSGGAKFCVGSHLAMMILQLSLAQIHCRYFISTDIKDVTINPFTTLKPVNSILGDVTRVKREA